MRFLFHIFLLSIVFFHPVRALDRELPEEVVKTAHDYFVSFLTSAVTEETKTIVGFAREDVLSEATLGAPFQLYTLSAEAIRTYDGTSPLESIVAETELWYFPVCIGGNIRVMLYVGKKNGVWMRAGIGSAGLAGQLQEITSLWPGEDGYAPVIVQQPTIGVYMFSIPQIAPFNLTETGTVPAGSSLGKRLVNLNTLGATIENLRGRIAY
ncbi:MAG: hypothetical protein JW863_17695 [Chitinispirillaceae bacterium]|nr:hypothetical protein [Chitinispirillaceae bacterium]